jgi:spore germination cell wall hydrolase CwlJ-like protein
VPNEIGAATHYHATYVQPGWAERMDRIALVGDHIFYREEPRQYRH